MARTVLTPDVEFARRFKMINNRIRRLKNRPDYIPNFKFSLAGSVPSSLAASPPDPLFVGYPAHVWLVGMTLSTDDAGGTIASPAAFDIGTNDPVTIGVLVNGTMLVDSSISSDYTLQLPTANWWGNVATTYSGNIPTSPPVMVGEVIAIQNGGTGGDSPWGGSGDVYQAACVVAGYTGTSEPSWSFSDGDMLAESPSLGHIPAAVWQYIGNNATAHRAPQKQYTDVGLVDNSGYGSNQMSFGWPVLGQHDDVFQATIVGYSGSTAAGLVVDARIAAGGPPPVA